MGLVDFDGHLVRGGIYMLPRSAWGNPNITLFYQEGDTWKSKEADGTTALLGSWTQRGIATNALRRIPDSEIKNYITYMEQHREEVDAKIRFLEEYVSQLEKPRQARQTPSRVHIAPGDEI